MRAWKPPARGVFWSATTHMYRLLNYLKDTRMEFRHVTWPTARQAMVYTALIIVVSIIVALLVGVFDFLFTNLLDWALGRLIVS